MSKRVILKKDNKIIVGTPTTVNEKLGICSETIRRWIRKGNKTEPFMYNGYEVFLKVK